MHLNEALDGECIDNTQRAALAVKKKGEADVINAGCLHDKVIIRAGVLQNFGKALVVVANLEMEEVPLVVLVTHVQCGKRNVDAAAEFFCVHVFVFNGEQV